MIPAIESYCHELRTQFNSISADRKMLLEKIAAYITSKQKENKTINLVYKENKTINLVYICTHNSRRSHFGQVWAHVAAAYFHVLNVKTFSGGTEATAFSINAINALKKVGFDIKKIMKIRTPFTMFFTT